MDSKSGRTWDQAFQEELEIVKKRHSGSGPIRENLVGLAFSGGGIRSATFGLGVLEGLKQFGLLQKIDYLSTVSGGGYIGAWLSANCKRAAARGTGTVPKPDWLDPQAIWKDSVDHLRRYSNYLSPVVGLFSADTWSIATVWLRNTILVQLTVILGIAMLLLAPRPLFRAFENWPNMGDWRWTTIFLIIVAVIGIAGNQLRLNKHDQVRLLRGRNWHLGLAGAAVCLGIAAAIGYYSHFEPFSNEKINLFTAIPIAGLMVVAGFWLQPVAVKLVGTFWPNKDAPEQINYTQAWVQAVVVIPMMCNAFLVAAIMWGQSQKGSGELAKLDSFSGFFKAAWQYWPFPLALLFISLWMLSFCSICNWRDWKSLLVACLAPIPAMLVLHASLSAIMLLLHSWASMGATGSWLAYVWTPSLILYGFGLTIVMLNGILGRQSTPGAREWWSRFAAWLAIYAVSWSVINVATVYGPLLSAVLLSANWAGMSAGLGWAGTTLAGLLAGKSNSTGGEGPKSGISKLLEVVVTVAPFVFIAGLLVLVSTVLHLIIAVNSPNSIWNSAAQLRSKHWDLLNNGDPIVILALLAGCGVALLVLAARVDINEFSLNAFYRSRLVRCYLGATRFLPGERTPQNFTGFDDNDDLAFAKLIKQPDGPFHIINCALNLGGSSDLALHTRHSATFTLTPLHCGSRYLSRDQAGNKEEMGYIPTPIYGGKDGQPSLGQAISVSGAAASPNMGYHTSPVVAFLLTLFNVRLGWWFPNPAMKGVDSPSPWFSLRYLLTELFGGADDKSKYLAISDGGHFENLAAYELVKRKCRVIIISDGECDPDLHFEGLGTLIRMCAVDFGATINIDVSAIRRASQSLWSSNRCAVGRIQYGDGIPDGILIYLKASMTGTEDTAVLQYRATHSVFPHESTSDQFYGEDQFESYRTLGRDVATKTFAPVAAETNFVTLAEKLEEVWPPGRPLSQQALAAHA